MYSINSRELTRNEFSQWNELVDKSSHGTVFHNSLWLDACSRSLGKKVKIFGCFQDDKLVGGISLFIEKKFGIMPFASSVCAMTPYGGLVLLSTNSINVRKQETYSREIIDSLIFEIKKEHLIKISIKNSPKFFDIRPFTLNNWSDRVFYTYYANLENNLESHIDPSAKKNIRKAEKNRIIIENSLDISEYYTLLNDTFTRKNMELTYPNILFSELFSFIIDQNCGEMMVARTPENEIACAEIVVWDKRMAYCWAAATKKIFLYSGAPTLLHFEMMKKMQDRGFKTLDLTMGNIPELSKFASRFNPTLVPYYQIECWRFNKFRPVKK